MQPIKDRDYVDKEHFIKLENVTIYFMKESNSNALELVEQMLLSAYEERIKKMINADLEKEKESKMTVTDYVVSLSDKVEIKLPPDLSPVVVEMKRLGNNLNQIAMKLNSGVVYIPDFKSVLDNQKVIYEMIYKLSEKN